MSNSVSRCSGICYDDRFDLYLLPNFQRTLYFLETCSAKLVLYGVYPSFLYFLLLSNNCSYYTCICNMLWRRMTWLWFHIPHLLKRTDLDWYRYRSISFTKCWLCFQMWSAFFHCEASFLHFLNLTLAATNSL